MKKRKVVKRIIITTIIVLAIIGIIIFFVNRSKKAVPVYPIRDLITENYWNNNTSSEGMVTEDRMQSVYKSSSQQIEKITVKEGQHVRKGDVLLKYSTTLSNIEIEKKDLEIKSLELDLNNAQSELEKIRKYIPGVPIWGNAEEGQRMNSGTSTNNSFPEPEPKLDDPSIEINPAPITGSGTEEKPYYFLWKSDYDNQFIESLINRAGEGKTEVFAIFMDRENGSIKGGLNQAIKIKFAKKDGNYVWSILEVYSNDNDPLNPSNDEPEPEIPEVGPTYTASEIQKIIVDKEKEISEINLDIKVAKNEYKNLKNELNNTVVYSKYDGTVKKVLSLEDDDIDSKPVIVVSSGGGFNIQGRIGEFDLNSIYIGQEVNVQSYESGTMTTGTITKISEYPVSGNNYGIGNGNVSYYPYTVTVSEDEELKEGEYVNLSIVKTEKENNCFYLYTVFIVSENGKNYVYAKGEDNKLEKREVIVGKNIQGMIEIKSGVTRDDNLAFPYGRNLKDGAKTTDASIDELYM